MRVLHVIHDFLPRHQAGSEIYAFQLCRALARRHGVYVLCAEYDGGRPHGSLRWRQHEGLPIVEIVNNWRFPTFADSYASPRLTRQLARVLDNVQPDVLHVHNLLNLSMDLPAIARARGIPSVATLHDYTLVCPSGGQRVHLAEAHVCATIDVDRCSRCFPQSPFHHQMAIHTPAARLLSVPAVAASLPAPAARLLAWANQPAAARLRPTADAIRRRLAKVDEVFDNVSLFVAPSPALGAEYVRLGLPADKVHVADYGFVPLAPRPPRAATAPGAPLRIGFVGTLVWHKGVHVLVEAIQRLPPGTFELILFGDVAVFPDYVATLRARAAGHPVRFMGRFETAGAARAYDQIDVLVVPSLWMENSPLVIHEAFMAGLPVIGARSGGIVDLVSDGVNGFLYDAFSPDALAEALQRLIADPALGPRLGARAPAVKGIDEDAREWEAIYARVVARGPEAAAAS